MAMQAADNLPAYDGTTAAGSLRSSSLVGKCSVLHLQQCAQSEWAELQACLLAIRNASLVAGPDELRSWGAATVSRVC